MSASSRRQRGTALVEILIVLVMSSLLIGLFLHADLAVNRSVIRWIQRGSVEQAAIALSHQLTQDLNGCDSLQQHGTSRFDLFFRHGQSVAYELRDSVLTRSGKMLLPDRITVARFELEPTNSAFDVLSADSRLASGLQVLTFTVQQGATAQTAKVPIRPFAERHIE